MLSCFANKTKRSYTSVMSAKDLEREQMKTLCERFSFVIYFTETYNVKNNNKHYNKDVLT